MFALYMASAALMALGFADFPLASFHIKTAGILSDEWIPLLYSGAMGVDAVSATIFPSSSPVPMTQSIAFFKTPGKL